MIVKELSHDCRSLRIHNYDLQKYIMNEILGIQDTSVVENGIEMSHLV